MEGLLVRLGFYDALQGFLLQIARRASLLLCLLGYRLLSEPFDGKTRLRLSKVPEDLAHSRIKTNQSKGPIVQRQQSNQARHSNQVQKRQPGCFVDPVSKQDRLKKCYEGLFKEQQAQR